MADRGRSFDEQLAHAGIWPARRAGGACGTRASAHGAPASPHLVRLRRSRWTGHRRLPGCGGGRRTGTLERTLEQSPYVSIEGGWDAYREGLGRKLASELRRRRRRLEEEGRFSFEVVDGREQLPVLLDEGFAVEAAGWKGEQDKAISSRSETLTFYRNVAEWAAERLAQARLPSPRRTTLCVRLLHRSRWDPLPLEDGLRPGIRQVRSRDDPAVRDAGAGVLDRPPQLRVSRSGRAVEAPVNRTTRRRTLFQAFAPTPRGRIESAAFAWGRPAAKRLLAVVGR